MTSSSDLPSFGTPALRLLLIDDEPETLRSVGALLRKMGHDVKTAGNGQEGLKAKPIRLGELAASLERTRRYQEMKRAKTRAPMPACNSRAVVPPI